jgi:hypothetical protein
MEASLRADRIMPASYDDVRLKARGGKRVAPEGESP